MESSARPVGPKASPISPPGRPSHTLWTNLHDYQTALGLLALPKDPVVIIQQPPRSNLTKAKHAKHLRKLCLRQVGAGGTLVSVCQAPLRSKEVGGEADFGRWTRRNPCGEVSKALSINPIMWWIYRSAVGRGRLLAMSSSAHCRRSFSTPDKSSYRGSVGGRIRVLRRLSLTSTTIATTALPVTQYFMPDLISLTLVGQIAIFGALSLTSLTSTVFLQAVTHAYVHSMDAEDDDVFRINRISWLGNLVQNIVCKGNLRPVSGSEHPFANFKDEDSGKYFYFEDAEGGIKRQLLKH